MMRAEGISGTADSMDGEVVEVTLNSIKRWYEKDCRADMLGLPK